MHDSVTIVGDMAHAIQLALAPVFLLTDIAGILSVMTGRLARIMDRGRQLTENPIQMERRLETIVEVELESLECRRRLASAAITASTFSALLVCTVIAALFLEALLRIELRWFLGTAFTVSTAALVIGLAYFLREVRLATGTVRILIVDGSCTAGADVPSPISFQKAIYESPYS